MKVMQSLFPPAWTWFFDQALPHWVKQHYSPKQSWKNKPFNIQDTAFFFKGIEELSYLFTEDRPQRLPPYFHHPKFRSAYLLYYLPLQAAKFLALFSSHPEALEAALESGKKAGAIRILDLGAGPGTASLALIFWLLQTHEKLPYITMDWFDTNRQILEDGKKVTELLLDQFPILGKKITLNLHVLPWWKVPAQLQENSSLILMGNILNEGRRQEDQIPLPQKGGGLLMLEPASRYSSQCLSKIRDQMISEVSLWGPCLHGGKCPLATGRDWCHFSNPLRIPGKWFRKFSHGLGSERQWLKFSYLWIASKEYPALPFEPHLRRVVSDPMGRVILLCEPDYPRRLRLTPGMRLKRGDLFYLK